MNLFAKFLFVLALLVACIRVTEASVLGIDLSAEFLKVAAVKSGNPFHIVVDEQAKRKIPVAVAFDDGERHFGNNAVGLAIRKPLDTFLWAHRLLGQTLDSPRVKELQGVYPYEYVAIPGRGNAVGIKTKEGTIFSPEELVAMSLQHVRKIAKDDGNGDVKDAVLTIPAWFSQKERQAVLDAAELAGISVMALINDNAATAITYGIDRQYSPNATHTAMIVDMGSAGTEVSIIEYSAAKPVGHGKTLRHTGQAYVKATATDPSLGGMAMDLVARDYLLEQFLKQHGDKVADITSNPRAMAKLLKQANTVKTVLSANTEIPVRLENLYKDLDLNTVMTREELNTRAQSLFRRLAGPINSVLAAAELDPAALDAVVIVGGSVRIPGVQTTIKELLKRETLSQNVNGDEAMAMGAVFRAANVSTIFQVRQFGIVDSATYGVNVDIEGDGLSKHVELFPQFSVLGRKKIVTIAHNGDLRVTLSHPRAQLQPGTPAVFASFDVSGVSTLVADAKYAPLLEDGKVKIALAVTLSESGLAAVTGAEAVLDMPEEAAEGDKVADSKEKVKKVRVPLTVVARDDTLDAAQGHVTDNGFVGLTTASKGEAQKVLDALTAADTARRALAAARNTLEAQIYTVRNELYDDAFEAVTTEEQRNAMRAASEVAEEWLYSTDDNTSIADYETQLSKLNEIFLAAAYRKRQGPARESARQTVAAALEKARAQVKEWESKKPWVKDASEGVVTLIEAIEKDVAALIAAQASVPAHETPAFDANELLVKLKPLATLVARVDKMKKPKPVKTTNTTSNSTASEDAKTDKAEDAEPKMDEKSSESTEAPSDADKADKKKDEL